MTDKKQSEITEGKFVEMSNEKSNAYEDTLTYLQENKDKFVACIIFVDDSIEEETNISAYTAVDGQYDIKGVSNMTIEHGKYMLDAAIERDIENKK